VRPIRFNDPEPPDALMWGWAWDTPASSFRHLEFWLHVIGNGQGDIIDDTRKVWCGEPGDIFQACMSALPESYFMQPEHVALTDGQRVEIYPVYAEPKSRFLRLLGHLKP
jgi:hypothetical protein